MQLWKKAFQDNIAKIEERPTIVRENWEFNSPFNADLWEAWGEEAHDPDGCLPDFMRRGSPMGMECRIPASGGFPPAVVRGVKVSGQDLGQKGHHFGSFPEIQ